MGGISANPNEAMTETNLQATIETDVDGIFDAVLKAGFLPGQRVRVDIEYVEDDGDTPSGFVLVETAGKRVLHGVTLETMPQAIRKLGIRPDQTFSIIVEREENAPEADTAKGDEEGSRLGKLRALKGAGSRLHGERTMEDIDAQIREFRGDE